jgi:diacylglycerol O-acyltransferase 1
MIENFRKYGVLICFTCHNYNPKDVQYGLLLYFSIPLHLLFAYLIELIAASRAKVVVAKLKKDESPSHDKHVEYQRKSFRMAWYLIALAHGINATLNLVISTFVVYYYIYHPGIGTACELHAVIVWLKTCSYAFANRDLRDALLSPEANESMPELYKSCPYPNNVTFGNLMYFWWAPTLVYQPVYPRTDRIRWVFVLKRLGEAVGLAIVIWFASAQYAVPLLVNSLEHIHSLDMISIAERTMKLSTISLACWLAGFFALFQSFLNALAEIMRFGDREFYSDWWNVSSIRTYWTSWNKPVYYFMRRHIYAPIVARGVPPAVAQLIVFVFSGFLHELLVGVPTHNIIGKYFNPSSERFCKMKLTQSL